MTIRDVKKKVDGEGGEVALSGHYFQTAAKAAPLTVGELAKLRTEERTDLLVKFVSDERFICPIGVKMARSQAIQFNLLSGDLGKPVIHQLAKSVTYLQDKKAGAVIIMPPKEPTSFRQLSQMVAQIHGDLAIAAMLAGEFDLNSLTSIIAQLKSENGSKKGLSALVQDNSGKIPYLRLNSIVRADLVNLAKTSSKGAEEILSSFGRKLVIQQPNGLPIIGNQNDPQGALQIITMSPFYHQSRQKDFPASLKDLVIPHGRYAPVTCLVVNYVTEVMRHKSETQDGYNAKLKLANHTALYNRYSHKAHRYEPSDVICPEYRVIVNKPDWQYAGVFGLVEQALSVSESGSNNQQESELNTEDLLRTLNANMLRLSLMLTRVEMLKNRQKEPNDDK